MVPTLRIELRFDAYKATVIAVILSGHGPRDRTRTYTLLRICRLKRHAATSYATRGYST